MSYLSLCSNIYLAELLEAGSKHKNTRKVNRDVMKADDIPLFLYLAAFIAENWKMLATEKNSCCEKTQRIAPFPSSSPV